MKKSFTFLALVFLFLFSPVLAYAHFPATDGNMTVTLHVDPNDDPIPQKQAHLYFLFNDTTKRFQLSNCNCTVSVTELGKQTYTQKLTDNKDSKPSIWGASMPYIFPAMDVYHIVLTGTPKKANQFEPFTVSWYFRVDTTLPGLVRQGPSDIEVLLAAFMIVVIGLVIFGLFIRREVTSK